MSIDGRAHLEQAKAVINAGKPLYIGRPMVAKLEDAIAIFALAKEKNVPVFSCSQHRYSPGFIGMHIPDAQGRPVAVVDGGRPIIELFTS